MIIRYFQSCSFGDYYYNKRKNEIVNISENNSSTFLTKNQFDLSKEKKYKKIKFTKKNWNEFIEAAKNKEIDKLEKILTDILKN